MEARRRRAQRVYVATVVLLIGMVAMVAPGQDRPPSQISGQQTALVQWVKFSPEGARFSVSLPAPPTQKVKDDDTGLKIHYYKLTTGAIEYQVVWFANARLGAPQGAPLNALFPRGLEEILQSARQAGKKDMVTSHQEDVTFDGCSGRESTIESATDQIDAKGFLAGFDFIMVAVLHPKEEQASADAKRFLASLSLSHLSVAGGPQLLPETAPGPSPRTDVDRRPIPLNAPKPDYTDLARNNRVQGVIRLRVLVGADGLVKDVRLASHLPDGLDEMAVLAARRMRFTPALKSGQPVAFWIAVEIEFNLREK
jgi:protein TonB